MMILHICVVPINDIIDYDQSIIFSNGYEIVYCNNCQKYHYDTLSYEKHNSRKKSTKKFRDNIKSNLKDMDVILYHRKVHSTMNYYIIPDNTKKLIISIIVILWYIMVY